MAVKKPSGPESSRGEASARKRPPRATTKRRGDSTPSAKLATAKRALAKWSSGQLPRTSEAEEREPTTFGDMTITVDAVIASLAQAAVEHADKEVRALGVHDEAAAAFAETLHEVMGDRPLPVKAARRAALSAAAATVWEDALGPLFSSQQVRDILGGVSRQRVEQLTKSGRLLALDERSGQRRYPAWQFGEDGRALEALVSAHGTLVSDGHMSPWSAASWCVHEHPELGGRSPRDWAAAGEDPERLRLVARRDAAAA